MKFKYTLFILVLVFLPAVSWADTHTANSCSYSDVLAAYNSTSTGDTVAIPAGDCSWSSTLNVTKGVSIIGAGSDASGTNLTYNGANPLFNVAASFVRISAMSFDMGVGDREAIDIYGTLTNIRIDHCEFTKGRNTIYVDGYIKGVIDNNTFTNCGCAGSGKGAIFFHGDTDGRWDAAYAAGKIEAGTSDAMFIEDNDFYVTNDYQNATHDALVYIQNGPLVVVRYNTFDFSACTTADWTGAVLNNHGNNNYWSIDGSMRATPIFEYYNNAWIASGAGSGALAAVLGIRGGSNLIHDNTYTIQTGTGSRVPRAIHEFTEYEAWQDTPVRTKWPAEDQVTNTFIWNETWGGDYDPTYPVGGIDGEGNITDVRILLEAVETFIQKDRDYFMHAPADSGGKSSYTGTRYGGSTTHPTDGDPYPLDIGSMTFSAEGANAYYPYTPYTHPHPLRAGFATTEPPGNLRITN